MNLVRYAKKGIIHVGANTGQERDDYLKTSLKVLWIEPIPDVFEKLKERVRDIPNHRCLCELISDIDGCEYTFHVSGQSDRSSFYGFTDHHYRDKNFTHAYDLILKSKRMDTLLRENGIAQGEYDCLVTDCQGADLNVLKSMGRYLDDIHFIQTEILTEPRYKDIPLEPEINQFLNEKGFRLVAVKRGEDRKSGDNFYVRKHLLERNWGLRMGLQIKKLFPFR